MQLNHLANLETKLFRIATEIRTSADRLKRAHNISSPHSDMVDEIRSELQYFCTEMLACVSKIREYRKKARKSSRKPTHKDNSGSNLSTRLMRKRTREAPRPLKSPSE